MKATFCTQLRSLLWKYFALKRYHWLRTTFEFVVPILLFLFVFLLKFSTETRTLHDYCYFQDVFLPSAGLLAMLQSQACTALAASNCLEGQAEFEFSPLCPIPNGELLDHLGSNTLPPACLTQRAPKNLSQFATMTCGIDLERLKKKKDEEDKGIRDKGKIKAQEYKEDPSLSEECNKFVRSLHENNPALLMFWEKIKRIVLGKIVFAPRDSRTLQIIEKANETFKVLDAMKSHPLLKRSLLGMGGLFHCLELNKFEGQPEKGAMLKRSVELNEEDKLFAALEFHFPGGDDGVIPSFAAYTIRQNRDDVEPNARSFSKRYDTTQHRSKFLSGGFVMLQEMLDHAIIKIHTNVSELPTLSLRQFPEVCKFTDRFLSIVISVFPFYTVMSFSLPFSSLVGLIVHEKEQHLKEIMMIMSSGYCTHWLSWFIGSFITWFVIALTICIFIKLAILPDVELTLIIFLSLLFIFASITQAFLMSCLFESSGPAYAISWVIYLFLYFVQNIVTRVSDESLSSLEQVIPLAFISQIAYSKGIQYIVGIERRGTGAGWQDLTNDRGGNQTILAMMVMLIVDCILYLLCTLYLEAVFPGEYGLPKGWCFCLPKCLFGADSPTTTSDETTVKTKKTLAMHVKNLPIPLSLQNDGAKSTEGRKSQEESLKTKNKIVGVAVRKLSKEYASPTGNTSALKDITLDFFRDEITIILGQNGAGKTTLFNILVGTLPSTSGEVIVNGYSVSTEIEKARESLGLCPQFNVLFSELTVAEHLWFYEMLKTGKPPTKVALSDTLKTSKLEKYKHTVSSKLSGGTQRKLSVCLAFSGDSSVVILDEPTSGIGKIGSHTFSIQYHKCSFMQIL